MQSNFELLLVSAHLHPGSAMRMVCVACKEGSDSNGVLNRMHAIELVLLYENKMF